MTLLQFGLALGIVLTGAVTPLRATDAPPRVDCYGDPLPEGALARMGTSQLRHAQGTQLVISDEGKTLISAGGDHLVRFWDVAGGKLRRVQHLPRTQKVEAMSADGKMLALSSATQLHLWGIAAAKEIQSIATGERSGTKRLFVVEFSPDGKTLAGGNFNNTVFLWDMVGGKERRQFKHPDRAVVMLAFSPDGKRLAAAGNQHTLLWDLASDRELHTIEKGTRTNSRLTFSPDGKLLALALYDRVVLWDTAAAKEEAVLPFELLDKQPSSFDVAFSADGKTVAVRTSDSVSLWDRSTWKQKRRWKTDYAWSWDVGRLSFTSDGKRLASLRIGKINLWDVESGKPLHDRVSHSTSLDSLALSADGKYLASSGFGDRLVRLWDVPTGKLLHVWPMPHNRSYPLFFTPEGANLIAVGSWGACRMWDVRGELKHEFRVSEDPKAPAENVFSACLSTDGKRLTALGSQFERKNGARQQKRYLTTWDVVSGKRIARRKLALDRGGIVLFEHLSPNGQYATTFANGLLIYDVAADKPVRLLSNVALRHIAFSPDSKFLAIGLGSLQNPRPLIEPVRVYDIAAEKDVLTLTNVTAQARAFTPDGRYLLTAEDGILRLWELVTGKEVLRWRTDDCVEMTYNTSNLAIASDGRSAAMGMSDPTILIWDLAPATRQKRQLGPADLDRFWRDLAGEEAARAYHAIGTLISDPQRSLPFLRERLKPIKEDAPRIRRLIADLGSDHFSVRDAAWKELEKMDDAAHAVLRQELSKANSLEQRRRMETLLKVPWLVRSPEKLRQIRAIAALEQIGTAEARRELQRLAAGSAEARLTREAKAALQRRSEPRP